MRDIKRRSRAESAELQEARENAADSQHTAAPTQNPASGSLADDPHTVVTIDSALHAGVCATVESVLAL